MSGDDDPKKNDDDDDDEEEEQRAVKGRKEDAEPKKRYGPKRSEPPAAAPVRRQRDSTGDPGKQNARKPKGKAECKKNQNQSSYCRAVDSFSERDQELSEYVN